jgi:hypothetical protein
MANNDNINQWGQVSRNILPGPFNDASYAPVRLGRYGEQHVQAQLGSKLYPLADEGSYFIARNPTAGTGIADAAAQTSLSDTAPVLFLHNNAGLGSGKRVCLDFIRLEVTAAGTAGTNLRAAIKLDQGSSRYTSGGTGLTIVNPNMDSGNVSLVDQLFFGALTAAAATAQARQVWQCLCRTVIPVVGDVYLFTFGAPQQPSSGMVLEGTAQLERVIACPPIEIGPQQQLTFHEWSASQSAAKSFEITMGWWER